MGPGSRIWTFDALLALFAGWAFLTWVGPLAPGSAPVAIPWWLLAGLVFLAEVFVVRVQFRGEAESFSLNEIPLVLGLFFVAPAGIVVAQFVGAAAALGLYRRQAPMKLAFNLALCAFQASLAVALFYGLRGHGPSVEPSDWVAAFSATMLASIVGVMAVATVVSLAEGRPQPAQLRQIVGLGTIGPLANTSLALVGVTIIWSDPRAVWLLAVPIATLLLAYRAYVRERQKHEKLEWLYEASRILDGSTDLEAVMLALLQHLRRMFRAEIAEIMILPRSESAEALAMTVGPGQSVEPMHPVAGDDRAEVRARLVAEGRSLILPRSRGRALESPAAAFGLSDLIAAPLHGDSNVSGAIIVANRLGAVDTFAGDDVNLLETVARQAAVALENGRLEASLARVSELRDELRHQAYHDPLTNLANRTLLVEDLERRLDAVREGERVPAVLFVDVDDFKLVNDSLGHAAGDDMLVAVAERIRRCLRAGDLPARLGGDEFAVLIDDEPGLAGALAIARRLVDTLQAPFRVEGREVTLSASIGIASANERSVRPDQLLRNADVAMYTAKARGKAQFAVFEPAMQAAALERHVLANDLQRAVANRELILQYQPVVDLQAGTPFAVEALVRWCHPSRGLIGPNEFIALADEDERIFEIGRWVLDEACRQGAAWQQGERGARFAMAVNISARQLLHPSFVDEVSTAVTRSGLSGPGLVLEITEGALLLDADAATTAIDAVRRLGVRIVIDDFGAGPASLGSLRRFAVDGLKMAAEFTHGDRAKDAAWTLAEAVVAIGRVLDIDVMANKVEHPAQVERLIALGCRYAQGFYFSRPLDASAVEPLVLGQRVPRHWRAAAAGGPVAPIIRLRRSAAG